jgi:hypothetical protein
MVPEHRELSQPQLRLRQGTTSPKIPQTEALPRTVCMRSDVEQMQSFGWPTNTIDGSSQGVSRQCQLSTAALARWTSRKKKKSPTNHNAPDRTVAGRRTTNFVVRLAPDARFVTARSAGYLHPLVHYRCSRLPKPSFLSHPSLQKVTAHILTFTSTIHHDHRHVYAAKCLYDPAADSIAILTRHALFRDIFS